MTQFDSNSEEFSNLTKNAYTQTEDHVEEINSVESKRCNDRVQNVDVLLLVFLLILFALFFAIDQIFNFNFFSK